MSHCTACHHEIRADARFCDACGAAVTPDPAPAPPLPQSFANGRYRVRRFVGEGAKKMVYLARDEKLDRDVALALIKTDGLDAAGRVRVEREAQAMARLGDHAHIVTVHDIGEENGAIYIVSQFMAGGSVAERLRTGAFPLPDSLRIAQQICSALEHAHGRGVIHRDLKPGNVWLMADGTAKLGDFGLALALDRSRMTAEGMMVGTVAYMAPEQALGGEVTARADLYSLGALLYELVTGRPPFVGDDAVAIVSQLLNTPPVRPSWHDATVPAGLEALILRLLEKDPAKRPNSAAEVRDALAAAADVPPSPGNVPHETPQPSGDPLYRRTFVGREAELKQLQAAFDAALSGRGALVTVVGEPGIGKTSVCEQLATYAAMRGGRALVGHCYEEGSLSLPYLPFIEAMRTYVAAREPEALRSELGSGAGEVARIVSEVRERIAVEPAPIDSPDESRWRLLQAVTAFLRNASAVQPLVIVLEDLHDADRGTLDLLTHIARSLDGARLLLVGTYRDVEVDRTHPLSGALAELRRLAGFARIALRGLTVDEVQRMLTAIAGHGVPWSLAESVHRATEGNPLFVQEVMRHLAEEGVLGRDGQPAKSLTDSQLAVSIPEGLRDVIGRRLSRLSPECNRVLAIAAVVGREFRLDTLCAVATVDEDAVIAALEEAVRVAVLTEEARGNLVRYRFAHAFFRQTLYEESIAPRRIRIHQQVARALETQYGNRLDEHAAELADHFAYSSDPNDLAKAVRYGVMAAQRATAVSAFGEAVHHLERALEVQDVLDPDDHAARWELLNALGEALLPAGNPQRVLDSVGPDAFALAEKLGDGAKAADTCLQVLRTMGAMTAGVAWAEPASDTWKARMARHAAARSAHRVSLDLWESARLFYTGDIPAGQSLLGKTVVLARELNDPTTVEFAEFLQLIWHGSPSCVDESLALARIALARSPQGIRPGRIAESIFYARQTLRDAGCRREAEAAAVAIQAIAAASRDPHALLVAERARADAAFDAGDIEAAVEIFERASTRASEVGMTAWAEGWLARSIDLAEIYLGRQSTLADSIARRPEPATPVQAISQGLVLLNAGRTTQTRASLQHVTSHVTLGTEPPAFMMGRLLQLAIGVEDRDFVARWLDATAPTVTWCSTLDHCRGRTIGDGAALLQRYADARTFYLQAIHAATEMNVRPEVALTRYRLAELLLDHFPNENDEARAHLDFAIGEFRAMKMQPSLERALRRKLELQGIDSANVEGSIDAVARSVQHRRPDLRAGIGADGTVTLLFSDIENSTPMMERLGDQAAYRVIQDHNRIVRTQLAAHHGHELELQGDGFVLAFASPLDGVRCAVAIQRAFADYNANHPDEPIRVRVGAHCGEAIKDRDKFFGLSVIVASRIATQAHGGEILVSAAVHDATRHAGELRFGTSREVALKGIAEPQRIYPVEWR